ncbi:SPO11 protein, partial [Dryoscopus gambensis]|nr:SPO11 protein [Dryoscopus gambensis]
SSEVLEAIENVIQGVLQSLAQKKAPVLTVANRTDWRNIEFKLRAFRGVLIRVFLLFGYNVGIRQRKSTYNFKMLQNKGNNVTSKLAGRCYIGLCFSIIITNTIFCLDRDIYYSDTLLFGSQSVVDQIINDISCMLKIPRRSLHVVS